jgi:hypothetical protein
MIIDASTKSGNDAGEKIANAISSLPSDGGTVDATKFTSQPMTAFTVRRGVTVLLHPGSFTVHSGPIVVHDGAKLKGGGVNSPGATTLKLANGSNGDVVRCVSVSGETGWWHNAEVADVRIDGNKANCPDGRNGVSLYQMGETSMLHRVIVTDCVQAGVYVTGSQAGTSSIENVTSNKNGTYGFLVDYFRSGILLKSVGGDVNTSTFGIRNAQQGGGSVTIIDPKSEVCSGPVVHITGGTLCPDCASASVNLTIIGGSFANAFHVNGTMIRVDAAGQPGPRSPYITLLGLTTGNSYTTIIDDQVAKVQVTTTPTSYHGFFTYAPGGHYMRFGSTGLEIR